MRVPKGAPASVSRLLKTDLEELLSGKVNNMLLLLRHPETGLSSLRFKCDCCGKLIDEAHGAMVAWNPDREKERECVPVVVCYECDGRDRIPSEFYTQELSTGLIYLLCNTGMIPGTDSFKDAIECAGALSGL